MKHWILLRYAGTVCYLTGYATLADGQEACDTHTRVKPLWNVLEWPEILVRRRVSINQADFNHEFEIIDDDTSKRQIREFPSLVIH